MALFVALLLLLCGCDSPAPGEACAATGDGFQRYDPCADTCVEWGVTCPGGAEVTPGVCSDGQCSTDADCQDGWLCLGINMTDSACLPADVCPETTADIGGGGVVAAPAESALGALD